MLLISLETVVPLSPSKSPSLAVERPILPRAFRATGGPPPGPEIKRPAMRRIDAPVDRPWFASFARVRFLRSMDLFSVKLL